MQKIFSATSDTIKRTKRDIKFIKKIGFEK